MLLPGALVQARKEPGLLAWLLLVLLVQLLPEPELLPVWLLPV